MCFTSSYFGLTLTSIKINKILNSTQIHIWLMFHSRCARSKRSSSRRIDPRESSVRLGRIHKVRTRNWCLILISQQSWLLFKMPVSRTALSFRTAATASSLGSNCFSSRDRTALLRSTGWQDSDRNADTRHASFWKPNADVVPASTDFSDATASAGPCSRSSSLPDRHKLFFRYVAPNLNRTLKIA